ncbi:universal stress protein [Nocardiopsis sp. NPDC006139]|uniref:universal stress protein n=1 Tax=Nocardiopsis TaxID=2013 RepID=UPI001599527A|nr:universal stress protein [Nocardiopsis flavescens]
MSERKRPPAVVVGVDGTSGARAALAWAVGAAARRRVQLRIVHGLGPEAVVGAAAVGRGTAGRGSAGEARASAHELLTESAEYARRARPDVEVITVLAVADAPAVLLEEARRGDVIAVGSRGLGSVRAIMLGSIGVRTSAHAPCPVVVVPDAEPRGYRGRVVVGVDGSPSSRRALRFALEEALATDASVVLVHALGEDAPAADAATGDEAPDRRPDEVVDGVLADVVDERTGHLDISAVRVRADPVRALLDAGADADMVVVGSRGRGGVRGLVLGSVSQGVLHDAGIPVAVLPPGSDGADGRPPNR